MRSDRLGWQGTATMLGLLASVPACTSTAPAPASVAHADDASTSPLYRALGTEPFWNLTFSQASMTLTEAGSERPVETKLAAPVSVTEGVRRYRSDRMTVDVAPGICSDGMTDRLFPDTVTVRIAGRTLRGCGGDPLPPADLVDTDWRIEAVNARVVTADQASAVSFAGTRFTATIGCTVLTGEYRRDGRRFIPDHVVATGSGSCPDSESGRQAAALLSRPAALVGLAGERMSIANEAGAMTLQRRH